MSAFDFRLPPVPTSPLPFLAAHSQPIPHLLSMHRPGPLQELPLELFTPNPNILHPTPFKSNKRPLSPSAPILYSPAKRRILNEEGIFSPDKTCKTPIPAYRGNQRSSARFEDIFAGPNNPVKLNFGLPMDFDGTQSTSSLASSSTFSHPHPHTKATIGSRIAGGASRSLGTDYDKEPGENRSASNPIFIPRELPPCPDPHSIHYPGFLVYRDPHLISLPVAHPSSSENTNEESKENLAPKKGRQLSPIFDDACAASISNDCGLGRGMYTPRKPSSGMFTPGRTTPLVSTAVSPGSTAQSLQRSSPRLSKDERKEMRRLLKEEANDAENGDDSERLIS